jgi:hypothetical protein
MDAQEEATAAKLLIGAATSSGDVFFEAASGNVAKVELMNAGAPASGPSPPTDKFPLETDAAPTSTTPPATHIDSTPVSEQPANTALPPASSTASLPLSDLPQLDFDDFLGKLRQPGALLITKYFKSFLREFAKKKWTPEQQRKIVLDFMNFITGKMAECDIWRGASAMELDMAREGMEKLVMTKLYPMAFCPVTSDDAQQDERLRAKMMLFCWVREEHLDISEPLRNQPFVKLAAAGILFDALRLCECMQSC